ncbi:MAG: hypothetical protein J1F23_08830 [Oscillospiraceae bacterium]|nr:hypothetical protein [Oscillospiraceae bacterium]
MISARTCKCGCKDFEVIDGTLRCSHCERLAELCWVTVCDENNLQSEDANK